MRILRIFIFLFILVTLEAGAQHNALEIFNPLIGKTWRAEGKWGDGSEYKQEIEFTYSLDSTIVLVYSKGFIDAEQSKTGLRNIGVRQVDQESGSIKFWEYDVFGGRTEGTVRGLGKDLLYQYQYGESLVMDMWEYVDEGRYNFKVGSYESGKWKAIYLETEFKSNKGPEFTFEKIKSNLVGEWSSKAWSGYLNESWYIENGNELHQTAEYIENNEVLYSAHNTMEIINGELILSTIIENSNPKIFKATMISPEKIVFENSDYNNPNKVVYEFISDRNFQRTISGIENGQPSTYTFKFESKQ